MKVNQAELKQDKKDITVYAMKQKCPVCDHQMFFAKYPAIHTTAFFIYCRNCAEETELHTSKEEAAKQWLDMMMIKVEMTEFRN